MRRCHQRFHGQLVRATRQCHADHHLRWRQGLPRLADRRRKGSTKAVEDFPITALVFCTFAHGRAQLGHAADGEAIEHHVVVVLRQERRRRQNIMRVACALVQVDIDSHIAFQPSQRGIHRAAIGRGQHRVPRATEQPTHLAFARRRHLFRHGGHRNFA